jgi:hypothetical protein
MSEEGDRIPFICASCGEAQSGNNGFSKIRGSPNYGWGCCQSFSCKECYNRYKEQEASGEKRIVVRCRFCTKQTGALKKGEFPSRGPEWIRCEILKEIRSFSRTALSKDWLYLFIFMQNPLYCNMNWKAIATITSDPTNPVYRDLRRKYDDFVKIYISWVLFHVMRIPEINQSFFIRFERKETMMAFWEVIKSSSTPLSFKRRNFGMMIAFLKRCIPRSLRFWRTYSMKYLIGKF